MSWINEFCSEPENKFFCTIPFSYIGDSFNRTGILDELGDDIDEEEYRACLNLIQDNTIKKCPMVLKSDWNYQKIHSYSEIIYGIIHSRYILSKEGLSKVLNRFYLHKYGYCPRVICDQSPVIPVGIDSEIQKNCVKIFCPKCQDVYEPEPIYREIDGAYFSTTLPHLLLITYPQIQPEIKKREEYTPRIYGFKIKSK